MRLRISSMLFILIFISVQSNHATEDCRCVSIFLCNDETDDDDGNTEQRPMRGATERKKDDCESALEICCDPEKIISETKQVVSTIDCGIRNFGKIDWRLASSSYRETKFGEFPWMIAILHNRPDKQDEYICDGALIHRKVVLTAAHCVAGRNANRIKIRAGEWDTQTTHESLPHQDRAIESILIHGNYSSRLFHSVALLILSRSLEITENVNVICLPESIDELETAECVVSGWSRNQLDGSYEKVLKKMELKIVSRAICQKFLRQTTLGRDFLLDKSFICGSDAFGKNMWKGDGGSPFICPLKFDSHRFFQIGVSVRSNGRSIRTPNIFTNVLYARSWIDEQLLFHNLDNTEYQYGKNVYDNQTFEEFLKL